MRRHSNRHQNIEVALLERQVEEQFKAIQFSADFLGLVLAKLQQVHGEHRAAADAQKQVLWNQQKALEAKRDRAEKKTLVGVLPDDAFVRLRTRLNEQLAGIHQQIAALDDRRQFDTEVVRQVLHLCRNVYETYKNSPVTLKRQYLGLFWDRFVVQDRRIVDAVPTDLIRALQAESAAVINLKNWLRTLNEIRTFFSENPNAEF